MRLTVLHMLKWAIVGLFALSACRSGKDVAARLVSHEGQVERSSDLVSWSKVDDGARYSSGQAAHTTAASSARLDLGGAILSMAALTTVRFGEGKQAAIEVTAGDAILQTADEPYVVDLGFGRARLAVGSRVRLTADDSGTGRFEVLVGRAVLDRGEGDEVVVQGAGLDIVLSGNKETSAEAVPTADAALEESEVDASTPDAGASDSSETPRGADEAAQASSGLPVIGRRPDHVDVSFVAGESPVIHDPRPPTALEIETHDACPDGAVVELTRGSWANPSMRTAPGSSSRVLAKSGRYRYRVQCTSGDASPSDARVTGTVQVLRDAATRVLARSIPRNLVDSDGRRYTVLYQNRLPQVTFRWQDPPPPPYRLVVQSGERSTTHESSTPLVALKSGELAEGTYRYHFEAGDEASDRSTLRIVFDNAAAAAYLRLPRPSARWQDTITYEGAALPGWDVTIAGHAVELDGQGRFETTLATPDGHPSVAVRLSHPTRGVHYYVRRGR